MQAFVLSEGLILFDWHSYKKEEGETGTEREIFHVLVHVHKWSQWPGGQAGARTQELHVSLTHGCRSPKTARLSKGA